MNLYQAALMGKPSLLPPYCVVCGKRAFDGHHVVMNHRQDPRNPRIRLCGNGNTSGCHGEAHQYRLHFRFTDWWEYIVTEPMKYEKALEMEGWVRL